MNLKDFYQKNNINLDEAKKIYMAIGEEYTHFKFRDEDSEQIKKLYNELKEINNELFRHIPMDIIFTSDDTYKTAREMRERVQKEGVIYIYDGGEPHPFLGNEANLKGRAIHDVFAHLVCGCPFDFIGELNAYYTQRELYPENFEKLLFSEIPAQTAAFYYNNKSHDFRQRAFEAPDRWLSMCNGLKVEYPSENRILSPFKRM